MTHVNCRLTAKNRDPLRNPTLGNREWDYLYLFYVDFAHPAHAVATSLLVCGDSAMHENVGAKYTKM